MLQENNQFDQVVAQIASLGFGGRNATTETKAAIDPKAPANDTRLNRLCEIFATDESEERRQMAMRTIRKEYPGQWGANNDIDIHASVVLEGWMAKGK